MIFQALVALADIALTVIGGVTVGTVLIAVPFMIYDHRRERQRDAELDRLTGD